VTGTSGTASSSGSQQGGGQSSPQGAGASGSGGNNERFGLLSPRGSVVVDARTNTLIVRETTKRLEEVKKLIRKLDIPVRQVMIEARVVIADNTFAENLGVKFGVAGNNVRFGTSSGAVGSVNPIGGTVGSINGTAGINDALVDLGAKAILGTPPGALGMTLARGADYVLNLELQALQVEGKSETLSNPRVMTMDRCTAVMTSGVQLPVTTPGTPNSPPTVTYIDAVLELNVTPQITPSGSVVMNLLVKKDAPDFSQNTQGNFPINKKQVKTSTLVEDGETIVLGGVYEGLESNTKNKIPFFSDLPGIGFLFTNSLVNKNKSELLIFVTPKIVKDNLASD
jgi:type IV pilus assembly protein PilQ